MSRHAPTEPATDTDRGPDPRRAPFRKLAILGVAAALARGGATAERARSPGPNRVRTGDAVTTFAGNAQHTAIYNPAAQDLNSIRWSTPIDLNNSGAAHYGAPLITAANTVITPVKIAGDLFQVRAFGGAAGTAKYTLSSDYILPPHDWIPVYQPVLAGTRLYYPGAGGTVYYIDAPDSDTPGVPVQRVFYTTLADYQARAAAFNASVFINTPITADSGGNIFFGFRMVGTAPAPLSTTQGGFARIAPNGAASYVLAGAAANDPLISRDSHNSAPALSNDEQTLYAVVKGAASDSYGYLLGLDAASLARKYRVFLKDPRNSDNAVIADFSTSSPTVAPDNDVYFGVLGGPTSASQGFLLRFTKDLSVEKAPGAFGWDNTAAIVPREMVSSYTGTSSYLIFSKYNNYATLAGGAENGVNKIAVLDPASTEINPRDPSSGTPVMREVLTMVGPTPDAEFFSIPTAVREWCINTAAVNPATHSVFTPSEDGHLYRWDLSANSLSQAVQLSPGVGEPYVPTVIGPDGTVFTLNGGTLFALGNVNGVRINVSSSVPGDRAAVATRPLTFTAAVANPGPGGVPTGSVIFQDTVYFVAGPGDLQSTTTVLCAGVALDGTGHASCATAALSAGTHFIAAVYSGAINFSAGNAVLIQRIHDHPSSTALASSPNPSLPGQAVTFTATVSSVPPGTGTPSGMVTFQEGPDTLAQVPLDAGGVASFSTAALSPRAHVITAVYSSDSHFASSARSLTQVVQNAGPAPFIALQQIASGLGSITSITNAGDSRLFLTIQSGRVLIFSGGSILPTPFLDVTPFISCCGERGLLSVAFHPQYASNGFLFVYATDVAGNIEITRYKRSASDPNAADPATRTVLLTIPHPVNTNHNGGQLQFGPEGYLYMGTGDGGSGDDPPCNAQNDDSPLGKMLRIDVDQNVTTPPFYGVPASNPMAGQPFPRNLTWAKGLRNPFRYSFDRTFGDLWIGDVGQGAWEEVDLQRYSSTGGENYGWKIMEGNHCGNGGNSNCPTSPAPPPCGSPLFQYPLYEYPHGTGDCSIIGGYVYRGSLDASLAGSYVYGDLCTGHLWINGQLQTATAPGLQTFGQAADGELYLATGGGSLFRIAHPRAPIVTSFSPAPAPPQPFGVPIVWTATASGGVAPLQYRFWRYKHSTGAWTMVQDYSASNTFSWTPTAFDVGDYILEVWVRNFGSPSAYDAFSDTTFAILDKLFMGATLLPDGRAVTATMPPGGVTYNSHLAVGRSYAVEVDPVAVGAPAPSPVVSFSRGDGTALTGSVVSRGACAPAASARMAVLPTFADLAAGPIEMTVFDGGTSGYPFRVRIAETSLYCPRWSINGYVASIDVQNTSTCAVSGAIALLDPAGSLVTTLPFSLAAAASTQITIPSGLSSTTGSALLAHDGPPASIAAGIYVIQPGGFQSGFRWLFLDSRSSASTDGK